MSTRDLKHPWKPSVWIFLDLSYRTWELVIARDQDLCEGAIFYYFLWETVQDRARSCRTC